MNITKKTTKSVIEQSRERRDAIVKQGAREPPLLDGAQRATILTLLAEGATLAEIFRYAALRATATSTQLAMLMGSSMLQCAARRHTGPRLRSLRPPKLAKQRAAAATPT